MTYAYARALRSPLVHDATLAAAWLVVFFVQGSGGFRTFLLVSIPLVMGWGAMTLHFPSRVAVDETGIAFSRYGREHRFLWTDVARLHVRRFVVQDRVLVRVEPASAWRGKSWILDSIEGWSALVAALDARRSSATR
jgi:hypothetical protein